MHIPKSDTQHTEILTFEEAQKHREESAVYDREKWLYIPDFYSEYRYILGTAGKKPLITIGINPSTAEPDNLDNTLKSVERIALFNGFDSFIMFNVYAQRATNPDHMDKAFNRALHEENMNAFRWVLSRSGEEPGIWAAWGTIVEKRDYLKTCLADRRPSATHSMQSGIRQASPLKRDTRTTRCICERTRNWRTLTWRHI